MPSKAGGNVGREKLGSTDLQTHKMTRSTAGRCCECRRPILRWRKSGEERALQTLWLLSMQRLRKTYQILGIHANNAAPRAINVRYKSEGDGEYKR